MYIYINTTIYCYQLYSIAIYVDSYSRLSRLTNIVCHWNCTICRGDCVTQLLYTHQRHHYVVTPGYLTCYAPLLDAPGHQYQPVVTHGNPYYYYCSQCTTLVQYNAMVFFN